MSLYSWLLFDLDETLYAAGSGLWEEISIRIHSYMLEKVKIAPTDIDRLREAYLDSYGTTLAGLMAHHTIDPHEYLAYVHDVPLENYVHTDPELQAMLSALPHNKAILTNASEQHAQRVLSCLGVARFFPLVIGVETLAFVNKPHPDAYRTALDLLGNPDPEECMLIDDRIANLEGAAVLGMGTILIGKHASETWITAAIPRVHDLQMVLSPG